VVEQALAQNSCSLTPARYCPASAQASALFTCRRPATLRCLRPYFATWLQVRITSQGKSRSYISYGTSLLAEKGHSSVVLKAMGKAINKTVTIGVCVGGCEGAGL
jgi:hypothetical protein